MKLKKLYRRLTGRCQICGVKKKNHPTLKGVRLCYITPMYPPKSFSPKYL